MRLTARDDVVGSLPDFPDAEVTELDTYGAVDGRVAMAMANTPTLVRRTAMLTDEYANNE